MTTQLYTLRSRPLSEMERLELDLRRASDVLRFTKEDNRVLKLANKSLARMTSPEVTDLIDAVKAWRSAIDPGRPDGVHAAEQRLLAALAAVEERQE